MNLSWSRLFSVGVQVMYHWMSRALLPTVVFALYGCNSEVDSGPDGMPPPVRLWRCRTVLQKPMLRKAMRRTSKARTPERAPLVARTFQSPVPSRRITGTKRRRNRTDFTPDRRLRTRNLHKISSSDWRGNSMRTKRQPSRNIATLGLKSRARFVRYRCVIRRRKSGFRTLASVTPADLLRCRKSSA